MVYFFVLFSLVCLFGQTKDPADSWTRSSIPNRGGRSGNDSYNTARGGGNRFNSNGNKMQFCKRVSVVLVLLWFGKFKKKNV